jgi:hypothetical protein
MRGKTRTACWAAALAGSALFAGGCEAPQSPVREAAPAGAATASAATAAPANPAPAVVSIELPAPDFTLRESSLPGYMLATQKCVICHSTDYIRFQPPAMTLAQWTGEAQKMRAVYGAPLSDAEVELIGAYLAVAYGSESADSAAVTAVNRRHGDNLEPVRADDLPP